MTTGSYNRNYENITGPFTGRIGSSFSKSWSGLDSTPNQQTQKVPRFGMFEKTVMVNQHGLVIPISMRHYVPRARPPKSGRRLIPHPYAMSGQSDIVGLVTLNDGRAFSTRAAAYLVYVTPGTWLANDQINLVNKLREKIQGSDFNAGIVAAEAHKTANLIVSTSEKLAKSFRALKSGKPALAITYLTGKNPPKRFNAKEFVTKRDLASQWLELQYGWLPLIKDVEAGAQALAHSHFNNRSQRITARSGRSFGLPNGVYPPRSDSNATWVPTTSVAPDGFQASEQGQIVAHLSTTDSFGLLGLTDPLTVAWELVPYSFVVDWFIPIGNYFSALAVSRSLTGTFVTTVKREASLRSIHWTGPPLDPSGFKGTAGWSTRKLFLNRTVSSSLSVPLPAVKPIAKIDTVGHALNALALAFGRPPRVL